jgi:hypothetical protein
MQIFYLCSLFNDAVDDSYYTDSNDWKIMIIKLERLREEAFMNICLERLGDTMKTFIKDSHCPI